MKFRWVVIAFVVIVLHWGGVVCAQSLLGSELPPTSVTPAEPAQPDSSMQGGPSGHLVLDDFLRHHPKLSRKLHSNPQLLNDPRFVRTHPELEQFIHRHPGSREQFESEGKHQSGSVGSSKHWLASFAEAIDFPFLSAPLKA